MLQAKRASFGDPLAESIPTHVTLLPPTEVEGDELPRWWSTSGGGGDRASFPMVLRGTGTFRPISPVVFVQVSGGLADCELLEKAVRRGPLKRKLDFYYHPHVTVAHHVPTRPSTGRSTISPTSSASSSSRVPPLRARRGRGLAAGPLVRPERGLTRADPQAVVGAAPGDRRLAGLEALRRPPRQPARGRGRLLRLLLDLPRRGAGLRHLRYRPARPAPAARRHRDTINDALPGFIQDETSKGIIAVSPPRGGRCGATASSGWPAWCWPAWAGSAPCGTACARSSASRARRATP